MSTEVVECSRCLNAVCTNDVDFEYKVITDKIRSLNDGYLIND